MNIQEVIKLITDTPANVAMPVFKGHSAGLDEYLYYDKYTQHWYTLLIRLNDIVVRVRKIKSHILPVDGYEPAALPPHIVRNIEKEIIYYNNSKSFKINKTKELNMCKNYIGPNIIVAVQYADAVKVYYFKCEPSLAETLVKGDIVVVDANTGLGLAHVARTYTDKYTPAALKAANVANAWIVNKVDTTKHDARIKATEKQKYILTQLEEKKKQVEEMAMLKLLAESDPEAKALIDELATIDKTYTLDIKSEDK